MTNRDRLSQMDNGELASFIVSRTSYCAMCNNSEYSERFGRHKCKDLHVDCYEHIQQWLEQEVGE